MSGLWMVLDYEQPGLSPPHTRGARRWLPQRAWLNGPVLIVEHGQVVPGQPASGPAVRQCDLAAASAVTLRTGRLDRFLVLSAFTDHNQNPSVVLAVRYQRRQQLLISPDALRLLAEAIGSRPGSPAHVARELRGLANAEERRNPPHDWSLHTSPEGWRWSSGSG